MPRDAILTHDAARVNSWSGYFWPIYEPDGSIWPWGSATLGFALGTANGAAVAAPGRRVVATCGDGGFLFTAMELATTAAYGLDVTVLVHDDGAFGSIAAYQVRNHGRAYATDLHNPDLVAFVRSFGIPAERVDDIGDLPAAMGRATSVSGPSAVDPRRRRSASPGADPVARFGAPSGDDQLAAMDVDVRAGDVRRLVGREERDQRRDLGGARRDVPSGIAARTFSIRAASVDSRTIGVSTMPGEIALTVIPSRAHSRARCRVSPSTPALAAV